MALAYDHLAPAPDLTAFLKDQASGGPVLELLVKGARCAGCLSKIERGVRALPGVEEARLNLTTGKLSVRYGDRRKAVSPPNPRASA